MAGNTSKGSAKVATKVVTKMARGVGKKPTGKATKTTAKKATRKAGKQAGKKPVRKAARSAAPKAVAANAVQRSSGAVDAASASQLIDQRILDLGGWRGETLARMRGLIHEADPQITEEWKWRGTPVWSHHGIVCTGEAYAKVVKLTFARGAAIPDPSHLFNASLEGNTRRAIDIREGEVVNAAAFTALVKAAVARNRSGGTTAKGPKAEEGTRSSRRSSRSVPGRSTSSTSKPKRAAKPKLLSGGNPQIRKADGDPPVQAYIAAMPDWKREVGRRLDALIVRQVPGVRKAMKWNSPFYGIDGQGWFLSFHCFTNYVKVAFFSGTSLRPLPSGESTRPNVRYLDLHERDTPDDARVAEWVKQASRLPGWGRC